MGTNATSGRPASGAAGGLGVFALLAVMAAEEARAEDEDAPGALRVSITGRLMADATAADADLDGYADAWSDTEVRDAEIGVKLEHGRVVAVARVSLETEEVIWEDVRVDVGLGNGATLIAGHWKAPTSLIEQTSEQYFTSMERAAFTDAFGFSKRLGVGVALNGARHTFKAGIFGDTINDDASAFEEGVAAAARFTLNPDVGAGRTVHLGVSAQYREAADGRPFRYRRRPQIHLSERFVDTGAFADSDTFVGVEAGYLAGRYHVAGEVATLHADGPMGDARLDGAYVEGGVFLTPGDRKGYADGAFARTEPARPVTSRGIGAWEARGRIDWIDLDDGPIRGGTQTAVTLGLNWYATRRARLLGEYSRADIEGGPFGVGEVDAVSARVMIDW